MDSNGLAHCKFIKKKIIRVCDSSDDNTKHINCFLEFFSIVPLYSVPSLLKCL